MFDVAKKFIIMSKEKYCLDYIPGGVENNVLWLSYYQMTGQRNDECFRLRDLTTSDEWDIGRVNGYVDYNRVLSLLGGHTGLAAKIYNNTFVVGATDAIQTNVANMPIVAEAGTFHHDGFKFVAASSIQMTITDYAGIQLTDPPISFYANFKHVGNGYIFTKRDAINRQFTEAAFGTENYSYWYDGTNRILTRNSNPEKYMSGWRDKNVNGFLQRNSGVGTTVTTLANSLVNSSTVILGAYYGGLPLTGNIKTISISADNLYDYYNILAARC